jgi:hypothetical protein
VLPTGQWLRYEAATALGATKRLGVTAATVSRHCVSSDEKAGLSSAIKSGSLSLLHIDGIIYSYLYPNTTGVKPAVSAMHEIYDFYMGLSAVSPINRL